MHVDNIKDGMLNAKRSQGVGHSTLCLRPALPPVGGSVQAAIRLRRSRLDCLPALDPTIEDVGCHFTIGVHGDVNDVMRQKIVAWAWADKLGSQ